MTELLDWVDEKNQIIGQTTREESHRLGYPHRIATIFVFNQKGELLLNKRADNGLWDHSVGGHIGCHEDSLSAALREGSEEINLPKNQDLKYIGEFLLDESTEKNKIKHWFIIYSTIISSEFKPIPQIGEVLELKWKNIDDIQKEMNNDDKDYDFGFKNTFNYYLNNKDNI